MPTSVEPLNGTDLLLRVNTGTEAIPVWAVVGSQTDSTISEGTDMRDASSKDSRAERVKPGRWSGSISLEHLYVPGAPEQALLRTAHRAGTRCQLQEFEAGVAKEVYGGYIEKYKRNFPDQKTSTITVDLHLDGFPVAAP